MTSELSRRTLFKSAGIAGAAAVSAPAFAQNESPPEQPARARQQDVLFFFSEAEASFVRAAIDRLIPPDPVWPGAADAGVLTYIDRQLASGYGSGAKMYLKGPWVPDAPSQQGYQLRFTPAELYRVAIGEIGEAVARLYDGRAFHELDALLMDETLKALETGSLVLASVPSPVFFESLLANTIEGWFADPAYGGNREMVGWRMIGFPGAYAQYVDLVERHGIAFGREPISIADSHARNMHLSADGQ
ncbi:gluconate 2-dehydrogenase subunit 3 family protein [Aestuariivirga sp.]|uniref:gluconate 2-dehydrogenase subunit 3 family protein n=1 Tax=Aestuariivirga sp. TaxID=2650926 RepID=UPI00391B7A6E